MKKIIINADDFGISDGVCRAILQLFDAQAITGTSLMCAAVGAEERLRRWAAKDLLGCAGVHLQLTGGRPLSPTNEVSSLADGSGSFRNPRVGELPNPEEVEKEWRRQIEAAHVALGGPPTHLDTHHGVHRIEELFEIYVRLASEFGIPIRGADGEIGRRMRSGGIPGSVALVRDWTGKCLGPESLRQMVQAVIAKNPEEEVVEIICHPGHNDDYLASISSLSSARENDYCGLLELARAGWPAVDGHILASHSSLSAGRRGSSPGAG